MAWWWPATRSSPLAEFDRYRDDYEQQVQRSIAFSGQDADFFIEAKAAHLESVMYSRGLPADARILDVGCGAGLTDGFLSSRRSGVVGVDPSVELASRAQASNASTAHLAGDGLRLPFRSGSFDVVFAICVLHHVPPVRWEEFVAEMARVARPGGVVAVYEHNPFNPLTRLAVARCEFDEDAVLLRRKRTAELLRGAGLRDVRNEYILFFPWRGNAFRNVEGRLKKLALGAQYAVFGDR